MGKVEKDQEIAVAPLIPGADDTDADGFVFDGEVHRPNMFVEYVLQLGSLLKKNSLLFRRNKVYNLALLLMPLVWLSIFKVVLISSEDSASPLHPDSVLDLQSATLLPKCAVYDGYGGRYGYGKKQQRVTCVSILYAPANDPNVLEIMQIIADKNSYDFADASERTKLSSQVQGDILGFDTAAEIEAYMLNPANAGHVGAVIIFKDGLLQSAIPDSDDYCRRRDGQSSCEAAPGTTAERAYTTVDNLPVEIWYNDTVAGQFEAINGQDSMFSASEKPSFVLRYQRAIFEAIVELHAGAKASFNLQFKPFPIVFGGGEESQFSDGPPDAIKFGGLFYYMTAAIYLAMFLQMIVAEKENKTLDSMRMMGLYESAYWLSWFLYFGFFLFISTSLMYLFGSSVFHIPQFEFTDGLVCFMAFYSYFMSMACFAMVMASFIPSNKVALIFIFMFIFVGLIMQFIMIVAEDVFDLSLLYNPYVLNPTTLGYMTLYPPIMFLKLDQNMYTMTQAYPVTEIVENNGVSTEVQVMVNGRYTADDLRDGVYQWINIYSLPAEEPNGLDLGGLAEFKDNITASFCAEVGYGYPCYQHSSYCDLSSSCDYQNGLYVPCSASEEAAFRDEYYRQCSAKECTEQWRAKYGSGSSLDDAKQVCEAVGGKFRADNDQGLPSLNFYTNTNDLYGECLCSFELPPDSDALMGQWWLCLLYSALSWYLGQVFTGGHGKAEPFYFILLPWYWFSAVDNPLAKAAAAKRPKNFKPNGDPDCAAEETAIAAGDRDDRVLVVRGLEKEFRPMFMPCMPGFKAVNGLSMSMEKGKVFALLGHNGAGKTTAINIMTGLLSASGGNVTINGKSIIDSMGTLRHIIGACPQHDILWNQLTSMEHLQFFGKFQGMSDSQIKKQAAQLLESVKLTGVRHKPAGTYSGGMKRRLSVAIAALGNKEVVFLDEPTTGMDPMNRSHVWKMISELKKDKVVILTTHDMEEADALGDQIGIMSHGRLVALGNSLHLKATFGGGYLLKLVAPADTRADVTSAVARICPKAELVDDSAGALSYSLSQESQKQIPDLIAWVESNSTGDGGNKLVTDWGLSHTTLEDVFIQLTKGVVRNRVVEMDPPMAVATKADKADEDVPAAVALPEGESIGASFDSIKEHKVTDMLQLKALFWKSIALQKRQRKTLMCQMLVPLSFLFFIWGMITFVIVEENSSEYDDDVRQCGDCMIRALQDFNRIHYLTQTGFPGEVYNTNQLMDAYVNFTVSRGDVSYSTWENYFLMAEGRQDQPFGCGNINVDYDTQQSQGGFDPNPCQVYYYDWFNGFQPCCASGNCCQDNFYDSYNAFPTDYFTEANPFFEFCTEQSIANQRSGDCDAVKAKAVTTLVLGTLQAFGSNFVNQVPQSDRVQGVHEDSLDSYSKFDSNRLNRAQRILVTADSAAAKALLGEQCKTAGNEEVYSYNYTGFSLIENDDDNKCRAMQLDSSLRRQPDQTTADDGTATAQCDARFNPFADPAEVTALKGFVSDVVRTGLLGKYPTRLVQSDGLPGTLNYRLSPSLCQIDDWDLSEVNTVSGEPMVKRVDKFVYWAQEQNKLRTGFADSVLGEQSLDVVAAEEIINQYFPSLAAVVHELELDNSAEIKLDLTVKAWYCLQDSACNNEYRSYEQQNVGYSYDNTYTSYNGDTPTQAVQQRFVFPLGKGGMGNADQSVSGEHILLNGLTTALLNQLSATGNRDAASPFVNDVEIKLGVRKFPFVPAEEDEPDLGAFVENILAYTLVPIVTSLFIPMVVFQIILEKEKRLRAMMSMMGLRNANYWINQFLVSLVIVYSILFTCYVVGIVLGISIFTQSQFGIMIMLLLVWGFAAVAFAFFLSTFFSRTRTANFMLYIMVIAAVIASLVLNTEVYNSFEGLPYGFFLFPLFAYYRGIFLMADRQFFWEDLGGDELMDIILILLAEGVMFLLLTLYFDLIVPKEFGVAKHPLFFILDPLRYFTGSSGLEEEQAEDVLEASIPIDDDDDVANERRLVARNEIPADSPIKIRGLRKVYPGGKVAVESLYLHMENDQCFGLLGPNGAGKTTVISVLTGLFGASAGDAYVNGYNIKTNIQNVYEKMGICPQFDTLWDSLTVDEHMLFYARLKGIPASHEKKLVESACRAVKLDGHTGKKASELSGGMKRRLSLALSLIGNPSVVFLDEPTTGLDPETRRQIWQLIEREKAGRCIVLTTHSMEEADALCSKIGIMTNGRLRVVGTNLHLKNKFGDGFKVDVTFSPGRLDDGHKFMMQLSSSAKLVHSFQNDAVYQIAMDGDVKLSQVFDKMIHRDVASSGVQDFGIRQTSLEEVFLSVARKDA